jgi:hypothetical protein
MELLRRALLVGCLLPGLWLFRLTPLDRLLTVVPVNSSVEAPEGVREGAFVATGNAWNSLLHDLDALADGKQPPGMSWRVSSDAAEGGARYVFFRDTEVPDRALHDRLAAGGGRVIVAAPTSGGERYYRVEGRAWKGADFRPFAGFTGRPTPPATLLYPFQLMAVALLLGGTVLFLLLPGPRNLKPSELGLLAATVLFFAAPLAVVGGSVQALTRWPWGTLLCWGVAAIAMHLFAAPQQNIRLYLLATPGQAPEQTLEAIGLARFVRVGLAFLALALGPVAMLVASTTRMWNR